MGALRPAATAGYRGAKFTRAVENASFGAHFRNHTGRPPKVSAVAVPARR
jgi:hypothetical protein